MLLADRVRDNGMMGTLGILVSGKMLDPKPGRFPLSHRTLAPLLDPQDWACTPMETQ